MVVAGGFAEVVLVCLQVGVVNAEGAAYDIPEQTTIFLCPCGNSGTKPFCDGTHETLNFNATHRAVH